MRGALKPATLDKPLAGITPAHAGSIEKPIYVPVPPEDHPRACGEHDTKRLYADFDKGSPPRMRGASPLRSKMRRWQGITPAHAGSIKATGSHGLEVRDHPRACGEHRTTGAVCPKVTGSPPRMRGALPALEGITLPLRITPAHAGSIKGMKSIS